MIDPAAALQRISDGFESGDQEALKEFGGDPRKLLERVAYLLREAKREVVEEISRPRNPEDQVDAVTFRFRLHDLTSKPEALIGLYNSKMYFGFPYARLQIVGVDTVIGDPYGYAVVCRVVHLRTSRSDDHVGDFNFLFPGHPFFSSKD